MGWEFFGWSGDLVSTDPFEYIVMDGDKHITATFTQEVMMYQLTLMTDPMNAGVLEGAGSYAAGTSVLLSAYAVSGYQFMYWSWDGEIISYDAIFEFIMPAMDVTLVAHFEESEFVYCAYGQGHWFARPLTIWPYDVVVGGLTFTQAQGKALFWPANNPTKRAFVSYASVYLSGVTLSEFPYLAGLMEKIDEYFAEVYPAPAGQAINKVAEAISMWIKENECNETYQGYADFDLSSFDNKVLDLNGAINSKAYPNPFRKATTIEFMVQDNVHVTIEVFDMVGERMRVLFEGEVKAFENYMVTFDAKDLQSGFYFYRVIAGKEVYAGRLIMIK